MIMKIGFNTSAAPKCRWGYYVTMICVHAQGDKQNGEFCLRERRRGAVKTAWSTTDGGH
jgi:hypothetical protein